MNMQQTAAVLAKVKIGDNREVTELVIAEWHDGISDLDFDDVIEAVRMHRRETTDYLQVAHVRANVKRIRARREREERINGPRALGRPVITLDRAKFEAETQAAIEAHRGH